MSTDVSFIAAQFERIRRALPNDSLALSAEMIVLQEGIDLLVAYRSIPDRTTRLLIKALVEQIAPNVVGAHTQRAANINVLESGKPDAS